MTKQKNEINTANLLNILNESLPQAFSNTLSKALLDAIYRYECSYNINSRVKEILGLKIDIPTEILYKAIKTKIRHTYEQSGSEEKGTSDSWDTIYLLCTHFSIDQKTVDYLLSAAVSNFSERTVRRLCTQYEPTREVAEKILHLKEERRPRFYLSVGLDRHRNRTRIYDSMLFWIENYLKKLNSISETACMYAQITNKNFASIPSLRYLCLFKIATNQSTIDSTPILNVEDLKEDLDALASSIRFPNTMP